jgi:hypothetical protein
MLLFFVAFSFTCFQDSSLVGRMLVGVLWTTVALLTLWCIFTLWEGSDLGWLKGFFGAKNRSQEDVDVDAGPAGEAPIVRPTRLRWLEWRSSLVRKTSNQSDETAV